MSRDTSHSALVQSAKFVPKQWRATIAGRFPNSRPTICRITARNEKEAQRVADGMCLPGETVTLEAI